MVHVPLLLLCLFVTNTLGTLDHVSNGIHPVRGGDFVVAPKNFIKNDALLLTNMNYAKDSMKTSTFSQLISHEFGLPFMNENCEEKRFFPQSNVFVKPKLNLLFVLDSVPRDQLDEQLFGGRKVEIEEESFPSEKLPFLTSLLTGSQPREHGIVSSSWRNGRSTAEAYLSPSSSRQRNNVADVFGVFGGRSLVLSLSADRQLAAAVGPQATSLSLHKTDDVASSAFAGQVYYDEVRRLLQVTSPLLAEDFTATAAQLLTSLGADHLSRQLLMSLLPGHLLSVSLRDGQLVFVVQEDGQEAQELTFSMDEPAQAAFVVEVYLAALLATVGGEDGLSADSTLLPLLALDDAPDYVAFSVSSVRRLAAAGAAARSSFALRLFQRLFLKVRENQSQQYANRVAWQVVVPGAEQTAEAVPLSFPAVSVSSLRYFPRHLPPAQRQDACASLASLPPHLLGQCQDRSDEQLFASHHQHLRELMTNGTSGHSADDVFTFHVVLWFLVAVISGMSYLVYFIMNSTSTRESVFVSAGEGHPNKDY